MLRPTVASHVGSITYEEIADVLCANDEEELATWLRMRIEAGLEARSDQADAALGP
jgi:hypothetical protein